MFELNQTYTMSSKQHKFTSIFTPTVDMSYYSSNKKTESVVNDIWHTESIKTLNSAAICYTFFVDMHKKQQKI